MAKLKQKVKIWGKELTLRNSPVTPNLYRQEFDSSLMKDLTGLVDTAQEQEIEQIDEENDNVGDIDLSQIGKNYEASEKMIYGILKIVYSMNKTEHRKDNKFPDYYDWLEEFDDFDLMDMEWFERVFGVIEDAFFPEVDGGREEGKEKSKPAKDQ